MKTTTALSESITFGSKLLGIVQFAVDIFVGTVAAVHRVQMFIAFRTFKASFVPLLDIEIIWFRLLSFRTDLLTKIIDKSIIVVDLITEIFDLNKNGGET